MEKIDRDKYLVFKREDFDRKLHALFLEVDPSIVNDIRDGALDDCVVIRKKDTFAPSALYAYASSVQSAAEILADTNYGNDDVIGHLQALADYFAGEADHARDMHGRIPD